MGWGLGPSPELEPSQVRAPRPNWGAGEEGGEGLGRAENSFMGESRGWEGSTGRRLGKGRDTSETR